MVGKGQVVCNEGSLIRLLGSGVGFGQVLLLFIYIIARWGMGILKVES